ncbi:TrbC/VirB2 family protein [Aggregatibacter actinomycetemcomitans]|uniref:TrbC/VirB2 family protein n=1 Tax=Aggregatibacter actinomycetemcomitans TaxID=714 RepID=UPI00197C5922|nr:TrbC/VirB2 family protein [Aggregatibacter actinomycetemcomitans]MBN6059389.1 TrbC/VirB2 family protein [Aggregatibacter actinomycetemcomitans]MBN6087890.1 TrbC/VirB2 family protein [Aggregatibacter actinomycetemcomitans]
MFKNISKKLAYFAFSSFLVMGSSPAFAGGLAKTKGFLTNLSTELHSVAAVAFLIACYLVGFVVMYRGQPFESVAKLVYGCLIFMIGPEVAVWVYS